MRTLVTLAAAGLLAGTALAQESGSTYPAGSNLPQRTAGETGPKTTGSMGGSGGPTSSHKVQSRKASGNGARPSKHQPKPGQKPQ